MFVIQRYTAQFLKVRRPRIRVLVLAIALAFAVLGFEGLTVAPGNGSSPLFSLFGRGPSPSDFSSATEELAELSLSSGSRNYASPRQERQNGGPPLAGAREEEHHKDKDEADGYLDDLDLDGEEDDEFSIDLGNGVRMKEAKDPFGGYITLGKPVDEGNNSSSVGMDEEPGAGFKYASSKVGQTNSILGWNEVRNLDNSSPAPSFVSYPASSRIDEDTQVTQGNKSGASVLNVTTNLSTSGKRKTERNRTIAGSEEKKPLQRGAAMPNSRLAKDHVAKKRKRRAAVTISEMYQILLKNHGSPCSMKPRWSSPSDGQILEAKTQIVNAPIVEDDPELYSPAFRNISMFKRSYDLMEKMLKVYVYKEGEQPIFHQPLLTGIYASEGWFMKHMEASRHFVVVDPHKAHLFYIPFSSKQLCSHLNARPCFARPEYLNNYIGTIAANYPFWNRTGGADHFLAACHDWAPEETEEAMGKSIRALCNADVTRGFEVGKDVSLPETNVRMGQDPLRDVGGMPANKRPFLAFFAGKMHGYLRPILLRHWENRDPDMKVFGPLPQTGGWRGRRKTTAYAHYMKSSRYCICPRGSEVNSPRVVEAIFYGCVPVIISDNFVPPFFEVLNWEAFSVVVAERDVSKLKEILESIPRKKYLALQSGVRKVQRHFLWHKQPVKYDMFHMILHSVWFNRVFSFRAE